ncbi:phosphotransferase enzyme family protein [Aeoliella mucimassa]|uniref:phosphotransferase enzyme family protein n=1 Tax=Aeoliella mucimassa TaxID=2527972 RepID=UPI0018D3623B|nr:aminoglycoside phosphotransferase family protein [Aeoliella mucimassa]
MQSIDEGHINDTYMVDAIDNTHYVLQRINHGVFPDPQGLMHNFKLVTDYLHGKLQSTGYHPLTRRVLQLIATNEGEPYLSTSQGEYWRMCPFIANTHSAGHVASTQEVYQAGLGFGDFLAGLVDFPMEQLTEPIAKFHHGPSRLAQLSEAVIEDRADRLKQVQCEVEVIQKHTDLLQQPQHWIDAGRVPLRVTHNDTKCNNILLDNETGEAACVIDLDTVMPGLALYDLGDLVRTSACLAAEDETDLSKVEVDTDRLRAAVSGFVEGTRGVLKPFELQSLAIGPTYMPLIMATRFLTDYLLGDSYYKIDYPQHNLDRCRNQLAVMKCLQEAEAIVLERIHS